MATDGRPTPSRGRRRLLVIALFLLAPLTGEYLLGNQSVLSLPQLLLYAPMYGGGAVLIREICRRTGRGWPAMLLLGAAYALVEEVPIDQMLFNPAYLGLSSFAGQAAIPALGISASLTQGTLTLHTIWSIGVPIALVEAFAPEPQRAWTSRVGLAVVAAVFVLGSAALALVQYDSFRFLPSVPQYGVSIAVIVALIIAALVVPRPRAGSDGADAPRPRTVAVTAAVLTGAYWLSTLPDGSAVAQWAPIAFWFVLVALGIGLARRWSRRAGWGPRHRLACAAGAIVTYIWGGIVNLPGLGTPLVIEVAGHLVLGAGYVVLIVFAVRFSRRARAPGCSGGTRDRAGSLP